MERWMSAAGSDGRVDGWRRWTRTLRERRLAGLHWFRSDYTRGLVAVTIAYCAVNAWIILAGHGTPYVIDGNETFSVYWHSYNLFHFDVWKSFGLSDDAYSPSMAAHPVVHPHQGNWPRVFGFLIYLLGARTISAGSLVTAFTIGVAAFFLAYHFLARRIAPLFATIFCLVLMSDYVLYTQWHVVTYRVWHLFFVFSTLLCAGSWASGRRWRCIGLTVINYACLYYYELIFVAYVSVFAGAFTIYLYHRRPALLATAVASQIAGAAIGLSVLFAQLVGFYGIAGFKSDFYFTFLGRNHAASLQQLLLDMKGFYESHNIAFFYNLGENTNYLHFLTFARSIFSYDLQTHTPLYSTLVLAIAVPAFIGLGLHRSESATPAARRQGTLALWTLLGLAAAAAAIYAWRQGDLRWFVPLGVAALAALHPVAVVVGRRLLEWPDGTAAVVASLAGDVLLALAYTLLVLAVRSSFLGEAAVVQDHWILGRDLFDSVVDGVLLAGTSKWLAGLDLRVTRPDARLRVVAAALLVAAMAACLRYQSALYAQDFAPLWRALEAGNLPVGVFQLAIVAATMLVAQILMTPGRTMPARRQIRDLRTILVCGFIGYGFAFLLSAGYVFSGYLDRTTPFTVFLTDAVVAAAIYLMVVEVGRGWTAAAAASRPARIASTAMAGGIAAVLVVGWAWQQVDYVRLLPPDYAAFMTRLQQPPFRGATFAVGNYPAPVAAYTDQWAYDSGGWPFWASLEQSLSPGRNGLAADEAGGVGSLPYLWMADRRTNKAYETPQYYMCFVNQSLATVTAGLADPAGNRDRGCGPVNAAVDEAARDPFQVLTPRVVAHDEEGVARRGWEAWSIVKLDWAYPPTLTRLPGTTESNPVAVTDGRADGVTRLAFGYAYGQPQGTPEAGTTVELVRFGIDADCGSDDWQAEVLAARPQGDGRAFDLPAGYVGRIAVAVTPRTAEKAGRPYYSKVLSFDGPGNAPAVCTRPPSLPGEPSPEQLAKHGYLALGQPIDFSDTGPGSAALGFGWSVREAPGTWAIGTTSSLSFRLMSPIDAPLRLTADLSAFVAPQRPHQNVSVTANGTAVATWLFDSAEARTMTADIPASLLAGRTTLDISFVSQNAVSPLDLGVSLDKRPLTFLFRSLTIVGRPQAPSYVPGEVVAFDTSGQGGRFTGQGWSAPEPSGAWALGARSSVSLSWPAGSHQPARLAATVMPFVDPGRGTETVDVVANGRPVARWSFTPGGFVTRTADLPTGIVGPNGELTLDFESDYAPSPASLGLNGETRALKLLFRSLAVAPAP